jgi:hypothetical protein
MCCAITPSHSRHQNSDLMRNHHNTEFQPSLAVSITGALAVLDARFIIRFLRLRPRAPDHWSESRSRVCRRETLTS